MGSVTKGSGIAVSALVAATASVLLLVPGHTRAGYWRGTGSSRGVMVVSRPRLPRRVRLAPAGGARPPRPLMTVRRPYRARPAVPRGRTAAGPGPA